MPTSLSMVVINWCVKCCWLEANLPRFLITFIIYDRPSPWGLHPYFCPSNLCSCHSTWLCLDTPSRNVPSTRSFELYLIGIVYSSKFSLFNELMFLNLQLPFLGSGGRDTDLWSSRVKMVKLVLLAKSDWRLEMGRERWYSPLPYCAH